ncbi:MAG TPA: S8 family serine peptidase [Anaerolineales bacterium]|nr:S8 family serine peptidase [Anaerolineales bacterium]
MKPSNKKQKVRIESQVDSLKDHSEIPYPNSKTSYRTLLKKDLRLAEVLRLGDPAIPVSQKKLNPFQVKVGRKGRIWVDVLLERKQGVRIHDLERIMQVYCKPGRGRIISGRVRVERLLELDQLCVRMQTGRPVATALDQSLPAIKADRNTLHTAGLRGLDGTGVIIGIVDSGCDFYHPNFKEGRKTRLLYLWDQNGSGGAYPDNYHYGIEYSASLINTALQERTRCAAYEKLGYEPMENAHGTHVMDIAAGSSRPDHDDQGNVIQYLGVAPKADLIFVDLRNPAKKQNLTAEELAAEQSGTLGSSIDLVNAVQYIFEKADEAGKPAVVNLSLAGNGGGHNGTSLVETQLDALLSTLRSRHGHAIVIAAGNDYAHRLHTTGEVLPGAPASIKWRIPKLRATPQLDLRQEMEIWYPAGTHLKPSALKIEVLDPHGNLVAGTVCAFGGHAKSPENTPIWTIQNGRASPAIDRDNNQIEILVDNHHEQFQQGEWTFRISHDEHISANNSAIPFHAWIENTHQNATPIGAANDVEWGFTQNIECHSTINGIGNGRLPLVIGSCGYNEHTDKYTSSGSTYSSAGPSLNPLCPHKPELHAPGDAISSACAVSGARRDAKQGTSMAAPHVAGVIALMFQRAKQLGRPEPLTMQQIRDILIETASDKHDYDPQTGFGRVDACAALNKLTI